MKTAKALRAAAILALLVIISDVALFSNVAQGANYASTNADEGYGNLLQYEWPQMAGDSAFSRYSTGPAPEAPDILWKTNITGIQSYISAFNGKIFVCSHTTVYALDGEKGDLVWSTDVPAPGPWPAVYKIDETYMVVGSSCLETETGNIVWTSSDFSATSAPLFTSNVYSPEEQMFYIKVDSYIQGWNFSNPTKPPTMEWATYVSGSGKDGSGIQYGDGKVFPGSFEAHQVALDAKTGDVLWDTNTKAAMLFSGAYYEGKFYRGGAHDNSFYAFNAENGDIEWTYNPETEEGYFCTGVAAAYDMVYSLNMDGNLYALNAETGDLIWKYTGPGANTFPGKPTIADGKVYATTSQSMTYGDKVGASEFACLDAYTGAVIWKLQIESFAPRESVAIAYGNLYIIPSNVTTAVDTISGAEYDTVGQVWAMGTRDWSMWRHDAAHTGVGQAGPTDLNLRWKYTTEGAVVSSPTISEERAYFGSQDKNIYCVDARTGVLVWKFATQERVASTVAVVNGRVYTGTDDGWVYCLNADDGEKIWETYAGGNQPANFNAAVILRSSPAVVNGRVYVGALDNKTYCLNSYNGSVIWTYQTLGHITSSPAVYDGAVYVIAQEPFAGALYKLNAQDGEVIWKKYIPYQPTLGGGTDMHASPTVADGIVFAASNTMEYYAINATTAETIWTFRDEQAGEFIVCTPIYEDGNVYLVDKFSIVCANATSGDIIWSKFTGDELYVSPSFADNKIYVVTDQRSVWVLNATDGEKMGFFAPASNSWSAPSIYEGRLYVGSNDWNVYCLADYPALNSSITLNMHQAEVIVNQEITGQGQLSPNIVNASITVTAVKPDGSLQTVQVKTSAEGMFNFTLRPSITGNWILAAEWPTENSYYASAVSQMVNIQVNPATTPDTTQEPPPQTSPTPSGATPIPFDKLTFAGVPLIYIYLAVIVLLVAVILIAGYIYVKSGKE
ncbi:MAG: PQQ-binding-like beta-propeller repeat protein [Candidatus Bathyarchaeota archaeon]|nr:PQQ-binding-like beta-propeller repeat protein [Candidatus Bathyarchaeota archaeon]